MSVQKKWRKISELCLSTSLIYTIISANILGVLFGLYYYIPQLSNTSKFLWLFVIDSPLAVLFMALSLIIYLRNGEKSVFHYLAIIGNIKYGLWTVFVLLYFQKEFMAIKSTPMFFFLLFSHLIMAVQALLVFDYLEWDRNLFMVAGAWFILNDFVDYTLGLHTSLPEEQSLFSLVSLVAFSLTLGALLTILEDEFSLRKIIKENVGTSIIR